MWDVIIVGSGPAGLSSAVYTSRAGLKTLILSGTTPGGLLTTTEKIDNYLGLFGVTGDDLADKFLVHAVEFGAIIESENVIEITKDNEIFTVKALSGNSFESKAVIFAAGSEPKKPGVKGEELEGVSYCATCDGIFFQDEAVAVIGGGETAVEEAIYLSGLAKTVDVLVRGDAFRATAPQVAKLASIENVTIRMNTSVKEVTGEDTVEALILHDDSTLAVDGLFVAIGQSPQSHTASNHTTLYDDGFIHKSDVAGFFVAGDISNRNHRQVAVAVGDGARAGIDATGYLLY